MYIRIKSDGTLCDSDIHVSFEDFLYARLQTGRIMVW